MSRIKQFNRHAVKYQIWFSLHLFIFTAKNCVFAYFLFKTQGPIWFLQSSMHKKATLWLLFYHPLI